MGSVMRSAVGLAGWVALSLCMLSPGVASAAPVRNSLVPEQRVMFDEASKLYREKRYVDAREGFLNVFSKSGDARVLFNVAVCEKALGRYAEAMASIDRSLSLLGPAATPDFIARATSALEALSAYVGSVRIEANTEGVTFTVDGLASKEAVVRLDSGEHTIVAQKPNFVPASQRVNVVAREQRTIRFELVPVDPNGGATVQCDSPRECLIEIDGVTLGKAPVRLSRAPGSYRVRATVGGRPFGEKQIELVSGTSTSISIVGQSLPRLRVVTDRLDDSVTIDGAFVGKGNVEAELFAGEHTVTVASSKGQHRSLDLVLREREIRDVHVTLRDRETDGPADRSSRISPWWFIGGAAILAGAAATTIYFATAPTTYEGSGAGSLNPYVVTAGRPGGLYQW